MHIILMSGRQGNAVSLRIGRRHALAMAIGVAVALGLTIFAGFQLGQRNQVLPVAQERSQDPQLNQLALRVGELQARLSRIANIGDRVAKKAGVPLTDKGAIPGQGGPVVAPDAAQMDVETLARVLDDLTRQYDHEADRLTVLDAELLTRQAVQGRFPMDRPVDDTGHVSSPFGIRTDPFTGRLARHEGMDFSDNLGAPILAAESGVVVRVQTSSDYGNVVDIDHGNGLMTRYGHCSKVLVKTGDVVKRDQEIALIGSTGRSTGPHVHFEVRKNGVPQNPLKYLSKRL